MAEVFSRFKGFLGFGRENTAVDEECEDVFPEDEANDYVIASKDKFNKISNRNGKENNGVINMDVPSNLKIVLSNPTTYDECSNICSHLRGRMTVVLNLNFAKDTSDQRRIFDFVSGCACALDCSLQKVSDMVYVVAPCNVDILAEEYEQVPQEQ